ncbi:hypothetical protein [Photobacterium sanguinicancri]|uniref:Uncharacterized protein n=1 Tax=Photobacterium sanguinicancri TaxID=875932 RepID=A0AAW7YBV1_9GAMM|nr:hypothetical protein [Photobacterium sanguinicancri]MDO6545495.1 hypothetical protein [Photobacterium sanguinicancri]
MDWVTEFLMNWLPALSSSALLAFALWLSRNLLITRLTNAVRHEYDEKLTRLKAELTGKQDLFKADLRAKELQLESIKTTALSGITHRQSLLFEKQVYAIEVLWSQVIDLLPVKGAAQNLAIIEFDSALKLASKNSDARDMFEMIASNIDVTSVDTKETHKVRPFISPLAWAYFSAYSAILGHAALKMHMLKNGLDYPAIFNDEKLKEVISTALPHQTEYIEKVNSGAYYHLLDELETLMLLAFNNTLKGEEEGKAAVIQAAELIKVSEELTHTNKDATIKQNA